LLLRTCLIPHGVSNLLEPPTLTPHNPSPLPHTPRCPHSQPALAAPPRCPPPPLTPRRALLQVFSTQLLAVVLQQLLDQTPLPQLYMRTVLLCLKLAPALTDFAMGLLQRLISKQVAHLCLLWSYLATS
jgi:hypothetical protein